MHQKGGVQCIEQPAALRNPYTETIADSRSESLQMLISEPASTAIPTLKIRKLLHS